MGEVKRGLGFLEAQWRDVPVRQRSMHADRVIPLLEKGLVHLERCARGGADVRREKAFALWQLGDASYSSGREDAGQWYEQSLALYRILGDAWAVAGVLYGLGHDVLGMSGAFERGEALVRESLAIRQELGDHRGIAVSRRSLAIIVCLQGRVEECERLLRQSIAGFQAVGDLVTTAGALTNLGYVQLFLGKPLEAQSQLSQSAAVLSELGLRDWVTAQNLTARGEVAMWLGRYEQARDLTEAGLAVAQEIGRHNILATCLSCAGIVAMVEEDYARAVQLLREGVAVAHQVGRFHADSYAALLGLAPLGQGRPCQARGSLCEGLRAAVGKGSYIPLLYALPPPARLLVAGGRVERAAELYALAMQQPFVAHSRWFDDVVGQHVAAAAEALPADVVAAAQERGRARDLWVTARELVAELRPDQPGPDGCAPVRQE
jgi:tetratricopeptide (TPR) repeat protein